MPEMILQDPDGSLKVIEVGPTGPPGKTGPQGPPGPATPGSGRTGSEIISVTTEVIDEVTYKVATIGASNALKYHVSPDGIGPSDNVVLRAAPVADTTKENYILVQFDRLSEGVTFFVFGPGSTTPYPVPLWVFADGTAGTVQINVYCLPGSLLGLETDVWFPIMDTSTSTPGRAGQAFVFSEDADGDGDSAPDCTVSAVTVNINASTISTSVLGKQFPEILIANYIGTRPVRVELQSATSVTKFRVTDSYGATGVFNPDELELRVGDTIAFTAHLVKRDDTDTPSIVVDPVGFGSTIVTPLAANKTKDTGSLDTDDVVVDYDALRFNFIGTSVDFIAATWSFKNPGAGRVARFRLICNHSSTHDPDMPGYVEDSSDIVHPIGSYDVVVVGNGTANVGDPTTVLIAKTLSSEEV